MDESIGQPASKAGVDGVVAEKTVGIMLGFVLLGWVWAKLRASPVNF